MENVLIPMFDLIRIALNEIQRRLVLLGDLIHEEKYDYKKFKARANVVRIKVSILKQWWEAFKKAGSEGLKPDLSGLKPEEYPKICQRRAQLGPEVDNETISQAEIQAIAERNGWHYSTSYRWVRRYRVGGEPGLGKHGNPLKSNGKANESTEETIGGLYEEEIDEVFDKLELLGFLARMKKLSDPALKKRVEELQAQGIDKSKWTLRGYWSTLRKQGKAALRKKRRTDYRHFYKINGEVIHAVRVLHLIYPALPATTLQEEVKKWAEIRGFEPPSVPQVRRICEEISEALKLIAAGKYGEFRSRFRITYSINFGFKVIFQIDWTQLKVYARDVRKKRLRSKTGKVAPYLLTVIESRSRRILAWLFTYDRPDRFDVALVIYKAILAGGIPNELWPDFGAELIADHVKRMCRELDIFLDPKGPNQPQQKGREERSFQTFADKHWKKNPSYFGHLEKREAEKVAAKDTIAEMDAGFADYVENDYNRREHSSIDQSPMEYWEENIITLSADPEELEILLMEAHVRTVRKGKIRFMKKDYWHPDLGKVPDQQVLIRSPERYFPPDEILVYHNKQKLCVAFRTDSEKGLMVAREDIATAQNEQWKMFTNEYKEAKVGASQIKSEIQQAQEGETKKTSKQSGGSKSNKTEAGKKRAQSKPSPEISRQASVLKNLRNPQKKEDSPPTAGGANEKDNNNG